jgi:hypothetical protein
MPMRQKYNRRSVQLVSLTDQATDIIPIADMQEFLRLAADEDDAMLTVFIGAAVDGAEKYLRRAIRRQVLDLQLDGFPSDDDDALARMGSGTFDMPPSYILGSGSDIDLPYGPANSVTSITTYNAGNTSAVFSSAGYVLIGDRITLNTGYTWPTSLRDRGGVSVRYAAGYGPVSVPGSVRMGIMQHVVAMYECRTGCDMPEAARGLMSQYRILDGLAW